MKFKQLEPSLTDKSVSVKLRLRLFEAVVSPTVTYGLETCCLTQANCDRLDIVQRKMLRRTLGWQPFSAEESWSERGRVMQERLQRALRLWDVPKWSDAIKGKRESLKATLLNLPAIVYAAVNWDPRQTADQNGHADVKRQVGRPPRRWKE